MMIKMYDAIFGGKKFHKKCESLIKTMKIRMEAIKNRRSALEKYLRKNIEELLKKGLDIIAYGRTEELLVEISLSSVYDQIEQFCIGILSQLPLMDKNSDCPEECKENVASLMYAAARFSDLPELRGLRRLFTRKYGTSMENFVSQEFVKKLRLNPTKEMKMKLLHDIACSASLDWNPKALEQQLYVTSQFDNASVLQSQGVQDQLCTDNDKCTLDNNEGILHGDIEIQVKEIDEDVTSTDQTEQDRTATTTPTSNDSPQKARHIRKSFYERFTTPLYFGREASIKGDMEHDQNGSVKRIGDQPKSRTIRRRNSKPHPASSEQITMNSNAQKGGDNHIHIGESEAGTGNNVNAHVHPLLPSYDELAARVADLTEK